jgi:hypothetical protein
LARWATTMTSSGTKAPEAIGESSGRQSGRVDRASHDSFTRPLYACSDLGKRASACRWTTGLLGVNGGSRDVSMVRTKSSGRWRDARTVQLKDCSPVSSVHCVCMESRVYAPLMDRLTRQVGTSAHLTTRSRRRPRECTWIRRHLWRGSRRDGSRSRARGRGVAL